MVCNAGHARTRRNRKSKRGAKPPCSRIPQVVDLLGKNAVPNQAFTFTHWENDFLSDAKPAIGEGYQLFEAEKG
jgi:hypothetical protein